MRYRPAISGGSQWLLVSFVGALLTLPFAAGAGCANSGTIEFGTGGAGDGGGIPYTSTSTDVSTSAVTTGGYTSVSTGGDTSTSDTSTSSDSSSSTGMEDANPTGVSLTGSTNTLQVGNVSGGAAADDICPTGQVLIGFNGALSTTSGYIGKIRGHCGTLSVSASAPFTISVTPGANLPTYGTFTASPWGSLCPVNQVVVGFEGRSGTLVDQISIHCAPLVISGPPYSVAPGFISVMVPVGGAGGSPFASVDCPPGQIGTATRLRAGDGIDAFGIACSSVALTF